MINDVNHDSYGGTHHNKCLNFKVFWLWDVH